VDRLIDSKTLVPVITLPWLAYRIEVEGRVWDEHEIVLMLIGHKHPSIASTVPLAEGIHIIDVAKQIEP
jgi:hypothetical protein